jgi:hypothetical protein
MNQYSLLEWDLRPDLTSGPITGTHPTNVLNPLQNEKTQNFSGHCGTCSAACGRMLAQLSDALVRVLDPTRIAVNLLEILRGFPPTRVSAHSADPHPV